MPRVCTMCRHSERVEIDKALAAGAAHLPLSKQYGLSASAVRRHFAACLPADVVQAQEAADVAHGIDIMEEIRRCLERINLLSDACDRWLRDPDDPTRYDINPRAEDVMVTYWTLDEDKKRSRKKERLSELIERIETKRNITVTAIETKHADPRELLLKTAASLREYGRLLAEMEQQLQPQAQQNGHVVIREIVAILPEGSHRRDRIVDV